MAKTLSTKGLKFILLGSIILLHAFGMFDAKTFFIILGSLLIAHGIIHITRETSE